MNSPPEIEWKTYRTYPKTKAAKGLGLNFRTVDKMLELGQLTGIQIGERYEITGSSIVALVNKISGGNVK